MREEDTFSELLRLLKSKLFSLNNKKKRKQEIEYRLRYTTGPKNNERMKIGIVSDIEGAIDNARRSAQKLKRENPDIIVIAGDCYENHRIRSAPMFPDETNKSRQMRRAIEPYAKIDVPVFVMPGNHEREDVYIDSLKKLKAKFPKVKDMHKKTHITKYISMIFLGGYHNPLMTEPRGFTIDESDYEWLHKKLKQLKKKGRPILFVSHGPPMSTGMLDFLPFFGNVGDEVISDIVSSFKGDMINLHGHIHEKSGEHYRFKDTISINISSITNFSNNRFPNTGVIDILDGKIVYKEI
ncbi:MAG: metallophosphoesterase [Candidatus Woesearchaeota archaeon]